MADAEDLKSSGDFSSCGFDSHPGHHFFLLNRNELSDPHCPCTSPKDVFQIVIVVDAQSADGQDLSGTF